jgi:hypothetical protein
MPIQANEVLQPVEFPSKGVDVAHPLEVQPPGTTPTGQNVRAQDMLTLRLRGGSRPGLAQYVPEQVLGIQSLIQHLAVIVDPTAEEVGSDPGNDDAAGDDPGRNLRGGGLFGNPLLSPGGFQPIRHRHRGGVVPPGTGVEYALMWSFGGSGAFSVSLNGTLVGSGSGAGPADSTAKVLLTNSGIPVSIFTQFIAAIGNGSYTTGDLDRTLLLNPGTNAVTTGTTLGSFGGQIALFLYSARYQNGVWVVGSWYLFAQHAVDGTTYTDSFTL